MAYYETISFIRCWGCLCLVLFHLFLWVYSVDYGILQGGGAAVTNFFVHFGAESGVFALLAFLGFIGIVLVRSCKYAIKTDDTEMTNFFLWGILSVISMSAQYMFVNVIFAHYFVILGLMASGYYKLKYENN